MSESNASVSLASECLLSKTVPSQTVPGMPLPSETLSSEIVSSEITLLFHKPYGVLSQFTAEPGSAWDTLASWIEQPDVYAAGRLDADSEGLLLLTANGALQQRLTDPRWGHWRRYQVQVEGQISAEALEALNGGLVIQGLEFQIGHSFEHPLVSSHGPGCNNVEGHLGICTHLLSHLLPRLLQRILPH